MKRPRLLLAALSAALSLVLAGCGGSADSSRPGGSASSSGDREVIVDGSSTVYRISREAMLGFKKVKPDVNVVVNYHGTGAGFSKYVAGECDIIDASRPARESEEKAAQEAGMLPWTRFLVGYDGITVVVNAKNDFVKELSVAQLKTLFEPNSKIKTWKQVDPSWPDRPIAFYTPDKDSGTFDFFTEEINGKAKSQRKDVQQSSDDNFLVRGVSDDADALGYFGYAYYVANKAKLRAVPIKDGDKPAVSPSPETILDKSYSPLARPLYIYVKNAAMGRPEVAEFVKFYLENAAALSQAAKYVAATAEDVEANARALSSVSSGSTPPKAAASGG